MIVIDTFSLFAPSIFDVSCANAAPRPREGRRFNPRANPLVPGANGRRERERRLRQMARIQARRAMGGAA
ncbi:hypothetical protein [Falsiroseomonas sp.]|uniref:hypothetical protein n=1 Tax=Falsiroseomonas sp. TaxID=2870721 RepID=UPI003F727761